MKKMFFLLFIMAMTLMLGGCRLVRIEEEERKPVTYTVVRTGELPEEAETIVEEKKAGRRGGKETGDLYGGQNGGTSGRGRDYCGRKKGREVSDDLPERQ